MPQDKKEVEVKAYFYNLKKFLVIQTAFIGDVILATALLEKLHQYFPEEQIDICVRKGNESLFEGHPFLHKVHIWDKKNGKFRKLSKLRNEIRRERYDLVVNLQRYISSGMLTAFSGAKEKIGFKKNPMSFLFSQRFSHELSANGKLHEVERNQRLIEHITDEQTAKPRLYPSETDFSRAREIAEGNKYITMSPASVWFTKQLPMEKWVKLIDQTPEAIQVFILGGPGDSALGDELIAKSKRTAIRNMAGKIGLLGSAALMRDAVMNYVNDSAPLHLCSSMNAPVTAFFCSTVPAFGFTPLSDNSTILETKEDLSCRPCGLHGFMKCPKGHFRCGAIELPKASL